MVFTLLDTIYSSLTCNIDTVQLYVHWREHLNSDIHRFSERISSYDLCDPDENEGNLDMLRFRARLRKNLNWAAGVRPNNIQCAIGKITKNERGG